MTYDIQAARAERKAQQTKALFTFVLDNDTWTMKDPDDLPSAWLTWSLADYARSFPDLVVEPGFPVESLTTGDMDALIAAWLGASPGE
jgi:hypothetical protein